MDPWATKFLFSLVVAVWRLSTSKENLSLDVLLPQWVLCSILYIFLGNDYRNNNNDNDNDVEEGEDFNNNNNNDDNDDDDNYDDDINGSDSGFSFFFALYRVDMDLERSHYLIKFE